MLTEQLTADAAALHQAILRHGDEVSPFFCGKELGWEHRRIARAMEELVAAGIIDPAAAVLPKPLKQRKTYIPYFCKRWKHGLFGGLCSLGSYGVALWAMTKAPIAMVAALRETSVIFGMLLAVFFLGEKFSTVKLLAVILVAVGIFFMH